mmetsp:Transcript_38239/g.95729  ORF Transcript_38239/g.95729 Transcript_38239/m.95729 type:complete len:261 (-) Transcript_38239:148-930(-)
MSASSPAAGTEGHRGGTGASQEKATPFRPSDPGEEPQTRPLPILQGGKPAPAQGSVASEGQEAARIRAALDTLLTDMHSRCVARVPGLQADLLNLASECDPDAALQPCLFDPTADGGAVTIGGVSVPLNLDAASGTSASIDPLLHEWVVRLRDQHNEEQENVRRSFEHLTAVCKSMLHRHQQEGRPVPLYEVNLHLSAIQRKCQEVQTWTKKLYIWWFQRGCLGADHGKLQGGPPKGLAHGSASPLRETPQPLHYNYNGN